MRGYCRGDGIGTDVSDGILGSYNVHSHDSVGFIYHPTTLLQGLKYERWKGAHPPSWSLCSYFIGLKKAELILVLMKILCPIQLAVVVLSVSSGVGTWLIIMGTSTQMNA